MKPLQPRPILLNRPRVALWQMALPSQAIPRVAPAHPRAAKRYQAIVLMKIPWPDAPGKPKIHWPIRKNRPPKTPQKSCHFLTPNHPHPHAHPHPHPPPPPPPPPHPMPRRSIWSKPGLPSGALAKEGHPRKITTRLSHHPPLPTQPDQKMKILPPRFNA